MTRIYSDRLYVDYDCASNYLVLVSMFFVN